MAETNIYELTQEWRLICENKKTISAQLTSYNGCLLYIGDDMPDADFAKGVHLSTSSPNASFNGVTNALYARAIENETSIVVVTS